MAANGICKGGLLRAEVLDVVKLTPRSDETGRGVFFVYILGCRDGTYYTGYTPDIERRLKLHNAGKGAKYTRNRRPVRLAWYKACKNKTFAMRAENTIKKLKREDKKCIVLGARLDNVLRKYK